MNRSSMAAIFTPAFLQAAAVLFFAEFVRSAFLISFLPAYAEKALGFALTTAGLAVSIHYIADTGIKVVAGYLLDRFPSRLVVHIALSLALLGLFAAYGGREPWMLIGGAALVGIGVSPIWLICLSRVKEQNRASQMGAIYTVWLASLGMGPVAVNFALDVGAGFAFWLMVGLWCAGWLIAMSWKGENRPAARSIPLKEQMHQLRGRLVSMKPLVPGMVLQTAAAGLLVPVLPGFASDHLGLNYSDYSVVLIVGGACTAVFLIPMGRLSDRLGYKWFLVGGFAMLALSLYLLLYADHLYSTMLLAALLGISYSAVLPAWNTLLSHFVPQEQKGTGWGVLSSFEGIGIMVGPVVGAWVASLYDAALTVAISAFLLMAIALFYLFYPYRSLAAERSVGM